MPISGARRIATIDRRERITLSVNQREIEACQVEAAPGMKVTVEAGEGVHDP